LVCALAVGLVAAGCGSSDDDSLTKAEFLKQGNAICSKGNKEINQGAKSTFTTKQEPSKAELNKFAEDTLIPSVQGQIDDFRDLNPPSELEDQVNSFLDDAQAALDKGKADPSTLTSDKQDPFKDVNQTAVKLGLKACGG
jgi:hypothetical protein